MVRWGKRLTQRWEESQMTVADITKIKESVKERIVKEAEREQCCKDICRWCAMDSEVERSGGVWIHRKGLLTCGCEAKEIRERAWREHND